MEEEERKEKEEEAKLEVKKHVKFLQRSLSVLPYSAKSLDVNRQVRQSFTQTLRGKFRNYSVRGKEAIFSHATPNTTNWKL